MKRQGAAGILPAEESEKCTADGTSATLLATRFHVHGPTMRGHKFVPILKRHKRARALKRTRVSLSRGTNDALYLPL
jgi:hypothetical protein